VFPVGADFRDFSHFPLAEIASSRIVAATESRHLRGWSLESVLSLPNPSPRPATDADTLSGVADPIYAFVGTRDAELSGDNAAGLSQAPTEWSPLNGGFANSARIEHRSTARADGGRSMIKRPSAQARRSQGLGLSRPTSCEGLELNGRAVDATAGFACSQRNVRSLSFCMLTFGRRFRLREYRRMRFL
jgi:hypothetical protein